jgi:hypothetical protein
LQFSPPRHDLGAQSQRTAELLGRSHRLLGGLPVDVENPGEGEDKLGALLQGHVSVLRSAHWKRRVIVAGSSPSIRAQPRKSPMLKTQPWSMPVSRGTRARTRARDTTGRPRITPYPPAETPRIRRPLGRRRPAPSVACLALRIPRAARPGFSRALVALQRLFPPLGATFTFPPAAVRKPISVGDD